MRTFGIKQLEIKEEYEPLVVSSSFRKGFFNGVLFSIPLWIILVYLLVQIWHLFHPL